MSKKIAIAADHAGFHLKSALIRLITEMGFEAVDLGTHSEERVDYPDFGFKLARAVADGDVKWGIGICGSGVGMSIALNRFAQVRAALCADAAYAKLSREHNDANVLVLGARLITVDAAIDCVNAFLSTPFEGGRHAARVEKLGACGAA
jgi:ribose 5-phosphate isomerase B